MRSLVIALALFAFASAADATSAGNPGVQCNSGIPCGNTCIAKGQVCHVKRERGPTCTKNSKPCGATCIPRSRECHR